MAKSMRNAFIRVSEKNETQSGIYMEYTKKDLIKTIEEWQKTKEFRYALIEHTAEMEEQHTHWHIVFMFSSPTPFEQIKEKFPYGKIENCRSIKNCIQYLVHQNDPSKKQYQWAEIITNIEDMSPYRIQTNTQQEITIEKIIGQIDKGIIREYNQYDMIPNIIWSKHKTRIENALLHYKERIYMDKDRQINVVFMSGETGSGKTTFAKQYCEKSHKSYCISSSSNDPMQDYKGEDVLILDDLRDSEFTFTDLLKILDNHTKSTVRSRYHNKCFIGETIIITSYKPIADWYFNIDREAKIQLYRRIQTQYQFDHEYIKIYTYNEHLKHYEYQGQIKNIITASYKDKAKMGLNMLKAMGLELEGMKEVEGKIENMTEEEIKQIGFDEI